MPETYLFDNEPGDPIEAVYVGPEITEAASADGPLVGELPVIDGVAEGVVYAEVDTTVPTEPVSGDQGPTVEAEVPEATQEASGTIISTDPAPAEETPADA